MSLSTHVLLQLLVLFSLREPPSLLPLGQRLDLCISHGMSLNVGLALEAGQSYEIEVTQAGTDATVVLTDQTTGSRLTHDSPNGTAGSEFLYFRPTQAAIYELCIEDRSHQGCEGPVTIRYRKRKALSQALEQTLLGLYRDPGMPPDQQLEHQARLQPLWAQRGDTANEALTWAEMGFTFADQGLKQEALACFTQALRLLSHSHNELAWSSRIHHRWALLAQASQPEEAEGHWLTALELAQAQGDKALVAIVHQGLGGLYQNTNQLDQALAHFGASLEAYRTWGSLEGEFNARLSLAQLYNYFGKYDWAVDELQPAEVLARDLGPLSQARTQVQLGWSLYLQGLESEGEPRAALFSRAIHTIKGSLAWIGASDHSWRGKVLDRLGTVQRESHLYKEAEASYRQSLAENQEPLGQAHTHTNLAQVFLALGRDQEAQKASLKALDLFEEANYPLESKHAHYLLALIKRNLGELEPALTHAQRAAELDTQTRASANGRSLGHAYSDTRFPYHGLVLDLLLAQCSGPGSGRASTVWRYVEQLHGHALIDRLFEEVQPAPVWKAWPDARPGRPLAGASPQMIHLLKQRELLRTREEAMYSPANFNLPYALDSASVVRGLLDAYSCLLVYTYSEERLYLVLLSQKEFEVFDLGESAFIQERTSRLGQALRDSRTRSGALLAQSLAEELGEILLAPAYPCLAKFKRCLIVPDGNLAAVPFDALYAPDPTLPPRSLLPQEITYVPSATYCSLIPRPAQKNIGKVLVVADPVYNPEDPRYQTTSGSTKSHPRQDPTSEGLGVKPLTRLAYSTQEAQDLLKLCPTSAVPLLGFEATLDRFLTADLGQFDLMHFAIHGVNNPAFAEGSGLVFSLYGPDGRPREGFIRAGAISELKLNTKLVVLSACQSAAGREVRGEGLWGLSQAFMEAGSANIISSLWEVDDASSRIFFKKFYHHYLEKHTSIGHALSLAKKEMRLGGYPEPYFWACYQLHSARP